MAQSSGCFQGDLQRRAFVHEGPVDVHGAARDAKNAFGLMNDTARASPLLIEKHERGGVAVGSVEEYERLLRRPKPLSEAPRTRKLRSA